VFAPPSLSREIVERSFRARNGELGVAISDAKAFLDACQADGLEVFGWELWLVNHVLGDSTNEPRASSGNWCGVIPTIGSSTSGVFGGNSGSNRTRQEIAATDFVKLFEPRWLPFIRVNFTLGD